MTQSRFNALVSPATTAVVSTQLEVNDAGEGVPADLRDRIFERFSRGLHAGRRDPDSGTGLGLAIVAEHVHRHNGRVWAEERPGGGARFVVELPQARG